MAVRHIFDLISGSAIFKNKPSDCIKSQLLFFTLLLIASYLRTMASDHKPEASEDLLGPKL